MPPSDLMCHQVTWYATKWHDMPLSDRIWYQVRWYTIHEEDVELWRGCTNLVSRCVVWEDRVLTLKMMCQPRSGCTIYMPDAPSWYKDVPFVSLTWQGIPWWAVWYDILYDAQDFPRVPWRWRCSRNTPWCANMMDETPLVFMMCNYGSWCSIMCVVDANGLYDMDECSRRCRLADVIGWHLLLAYGPIVLNH